MMHRGKMFAGYSVKVERTGEQWAVSLCREDGVYVRAAVLETCGEALQAVEEWMSLLVNETHDLQLPAVVDATDPGEQRGSTTPAELPPVCRDLDHLRAWFEREMS